MPLARTYAPLLALLTTLGACEVGSGEPELALAGGDPRDGGSGVTYEAPDGSTLRLEMPEVDQVELADRQGLSLVVALEGPDGRPVERAHVRFALEGEAGGSSLSNVDVETNSQGFARTLLTAGSVTSKFKVRASALGVAPLFVDIDVRVVPDTKLEVTLSYDGARNVDHYLLRAWEGLSCADLAMGTPDYEAEASTEVSGEAASASLQLSPTAELRVLQVIALGSNDNVVATYCGALNALSGVEQAALKVGLIDTTLRLSGTYPLIAELEVAASAGRLADAIEASLDVTADGDTPNATRLLNAIQDTLMASGAVDDANWVAEERPTLAPALEAELDDAGRGLTVALDALAAMVRSGAGRVRVSAQLTATGTPLELAYLPLRITTLLDDPRPAALSFGPGYAEGAVAGTISAAFDTTMSLLQIDALRLELGLSQYGDALMYALADGPDARQREALLAWEGCDELASWAETQTELYARCDDACLADACELALDDLLDDTRMQLQPLDTVHGGVALRGTLPVYDTTGNGVAEHVQTAEVTGSWGRAEASALADIVTGTLAPPDEALEQ